MIMLEVKDQQDNIGFCRACDGCMKNGGICILKDDMAEILKMFQKADVLAIDAEKCSRN